MSERVKKIFEYVRMIALSIAIVGLLFKLEHWQGSSQLLIVGLCTLSFVFMLTASFARKKNLWGDLILNIGFSLLLIGILFRLQHWPEPDTMLYAGTGLVVAGYVVKIIFPPKNGG